MEKRMSQQHRPTLIPATLACFSLTASCAVSAGALHAAECIAKPDNTPPQGKHWYYQTDRTTNRKCWFLGPEGTNVQKSATHVPASGAFASQPAQRPTASTAPMAAPAATEAVAIPTLPPWPEAPKPLDAPPSFEAAPGPALAEQPKSVDAINPGSTPASNLTKQSQSPTTARSSPAPTPAESTSVANQTLALAMIAFAALAFSGSIFEVTRWLSRRRARNRWPRSSPVSIPYPRAHTSFNFNSEMPARYIPLPPKPLDQTERLAQSLQQLLYELQTKHSILQPMPSALSRSSRSSDATARD
jgi:hypothetical protein